jgi:predicted ABC-type exoprotein transport system permease subunit
MKDFEINIKLKLAALWTSATFCYIYGDYFELYTPDKVDNLLRGDNILDTPTSLFIASLMMVIPSAMIALSLLLKPLFNKWLNIIFGSIFTLMMVLIAIGSLTPWFSFYVFLAIVESILTATIVWKAIKWPKEI